MPETFSAFLLQLVTDFLFLGSVCAAMTGVGINWLQARGVQLNDLTRRDISILLPFLLVGLSLIALTGFGYFELTPDVIYRGFLTAVSAAVGKQIVYSVYQHAKSTMNPTVDDSAPLPADPAGSIDPDRSTPVHRVIIVPDDPQPPDNPQS
jgi:hypothetical protein